MTSAELIARAKDAQKAREGTRMPVRFPDDLIARARVCAAEVDEPVGDWVNKACRQWMAGKFTSVADLEKYSLATREGSTPITVKAPFGMLASEVKRAVLACAKYCEERRVTYTPDPAPEHYILEVSE